MNTFDRYGAHEFQHHQMNSELKSLVAELQPDPTKVLNADKFYQRPTPIGCALRVLA